MDNLLDFSKQKTEMTKNSKSARDFITSILDAKSFVETDAFLFTQNDLTDVSTLGEGVVTGYGTIGDSPVYVFCQNYAVLKGGLGKAHAEKIAKCMRAARKMGAPLISVLHTAGARLGEGIAALDGYAEIMAEAVKLSGSVPQICIVRGECFGTMSCLAALSDFTFLMKDAGIVMGAPQVVAAKSDSNASPADIVRGDKSGLVSFEATTAADLKKQLAQLLSLLPPVGEREKDVPAAELNRVTKITAKSDNKKVISEVLDAGSLLEVSAKYAPEMFTGLARLGGVTVGVIGNCAKDGGALLDSAACRKAARFVRMLDCFDIPLISFVDCKGVVSSIEAEQSGLVKDAAGLVYAISEAGVPKLSLVTGDAVGFGYTALAAKSAGFDYALSFEGARISTLPSETGAVVAYGDEIASSKNSAKVREEMEKRYAAFDSNPIAAAQLGGVDNVIAPNAARQYLISALQMVVNKINAFPVKKHGNMPY